MAEIVIDLSLRKLYFYKTNKVFMSFPVAIGKPSTPTPTGNWTITRKVRFPGGILGTRWMQLSIPAPDGVYGIHGTTNPWSIGKAVSHGCVRMYNQDVEQIFPLTRIGTSVNITSGRKEYQYAAGPGGDMLVYTVKPGDTFWAIARHFGVPLDKLMQANSTLDPYNFDAGMQIIIPD